LKRKENAPIVSFEFVSAQKSTIPDETVKRNNINMLAHRFLHCTDDGLEREFNFFKVLEDGVCTMCAPGDQRKSSDKQRERAEDQLSIDSNL
jgi:hypothetical protein